MRSAISCPTAAKTGTTSELVDAWLDGYTPNYSTAVWMGYPTKRVSMTDVHGEPQQGGYLPAEIWHAYMSSVVEGKTCEQFQPAKESISYQPFYGKFATTGQSRASSESENEESSPSKTEIDAHAPSAGNGQARALRPRRRAIRRRRTTGRRPRHRRSRRRPEPRLGDRLLQADAGSLDRS